MTDQTEKPKLGTRPPLGVKRTVETGKVKQSFSHGRSNTVVVEVKKRRTFGKPGEAPVVETPKPEPVAEAPAPTPRPAAPVAPQRRPVDDITARKEMQVRLLREAEEARMSALEDARRREEQAKVNATEDERRRAEENRRAEEAAAEEARRLAEERLPLRPRRPPRRLLRKRSAVSAGPSATHRCPSVPNPRVRRAAVRIAATRAS
jgi:translation initiation factor IF-2